MKKFEVTLIIILILSTPLFANDERIIEPSTGFSVTVEKGTGIYQVNTENPDWMFKGTIGKSLKTLNILKEGMDRIGNYQEISFTWQDVVLMSGGIRIYRDNPVVLFNLKYEEAIVKPEVLFPSFTEFPKSLHQFSYADESHSEPTFSLVNTSTPWLLFDDAANSFIISPASNFMVAKMSGDEYSEITSGLNENLTNIPKGYTHKTLLIVTTGINKAWELWGHALTDLHGKNRPSNDADIGLKYLGYWTDNGATYYYNYELDKGYEGTLLTLKEHYKSEGVPVKYFQLDSWWYPKSFTRPNGETPKNTRSRNTEMSTRGRWNRYGGMLEYIADKEVFPDGLCGFQKKLGLPLITHNRWIDWNSPYRNKYKISGVGSIDPDWWDEICSHIASCGVKIYEQDWLSRIFENSPEMSSIVGVGEAFMDNMAKACEENGLTMQYCMAFPRHFMQGSKYSHLTTIRVSSDRFENGEWEEFFYTSPFASALGIYPWVDVFQSTEIGNILLANLSAGIVGFGDEIGKESMENIFLSVRDDGVIVKPDVPITPVDESYIERVSHPMIRTRENIPIIASTYNDFGPIKIRYVLAWNRSGEEELVVTPPSLGIDEDVYIYNFFEHTGLLLKKGEVFIDKFGFVKERGYYIISPVVEAGIALLGDKDKFVTCGKQRIPNIIYKKDRLTVTVTFAQGENFVRLFGYAESKPKVTVNDGRAGSIEYDNETRRFYVKVYPTSNLKWEKTSWGDEKEAHITVVFER